MGLHLVGQTLDKSRSHYLAAQGRIVQVMRGIYVDADDDVEQVVLAHAVRIAHYLYPTAYLSGASAVLLGPTTDGRLFLSARRSQRTRMPGLEILQNLAPPQPSLGWAVVADSLGEFRIEASSVRQRFLEAFRMRSEHATALDPATRQTLAARLIDGYGAAEAALDALATLARDNGWHREGAQAARFLGRRLGVRPSGNLARTERVVSWHGHPLGRLLHDGFEWRWEVQGEDTGRPALLRRSPPGRLPPLLLSLLAEGWLGEVLGRPDERAQVRGGQRYLCHLAITDDTVDPATLAQDTRQAALADHTGADGVFQGTFRGPAPPHDEPEGDRHWAALCSNPSLPRMPGTELKIPMQLDPHGVLEPSDGRPFTHILKPAIAGRGDPPLAEWVGLRLATRVGLPAAASALVAMPAGQRPALVVERFDMRCGPEDGRLLATEDFCALMDLPPAARCDRTMERVARALRTASTSPQEDLRGLLQRALLAWLMADGGLHLKNFVLLKTAQPGEPEFSSVRLAPVFDAALGRPMPGRAPGAMALKINNRDADLRRSDFRVLARVCGLSPQEADEALDEVLERLRQAVDELEWPALANAWPDDVAQMEFRLRVCRLRLDAFDGPPAP